MKAMLRHVHDGDVEYDALAFICPGCIEMVGGTGLHMLPVNTSVAKRPSWTWDGNLDAPTLSPSILTHGRSGTQDRCHSYLRGGVFDYLGDSTHSLASSLVPLPDLPEWFTHEGEDE